MFNQSEISCSVIRLITSSPDSLLSFCSGIRPLFCSFDLKKREINFPLDSKIKLYSQRTNFFQLLLIKSSVTFLRTRLVSSPFVFVHFLFCNRTKLKLQCLWYHSSVKTMILLARFFPSYFIGQKRKSHCTYCNLPPSMTDHILGLVWTGFLIL